MTQKRHRWMKGFAIFAFLWLALGFGGEYATTSKDGFHPIGWLILSVSLMLCAFLAARQRLPNQ